MGTGICAQVLPDSLYNYGQPTYFCDPLHLNLYTPWFNLL